MRTVELLCDDGLDLAVREVWERLSEAGVTSLARNTHPTHRPHLTLASCGGFPAGALERVDVLVARSLPMPVRLTGLLSFSARSRRRVLSWAVVPTVELLSLHHAVWLELDGSADPNQFTVPGRWTPHLGLTRRVEPSELALAHEVLGRMPDLCGTFDAARGYDSVTGSTTALARPPRASGG